MKQIWVILSLSFLPFGLVIGGTYPLVGAPELLYLNANMPPDPDPAFIDGGLMMDASISTIRKDANTMYFFVPSYNKMTKFSGPLTAPFQSVEPGWPRTENQLFPNDANFVTGKIQAWIPNMYKVSNGDLLGFVHIEDGTLCPNFYCSKTGYRIGLAYSKDGGLTWKYCGDIIKPHSEYGWGGGPGGSSSVIGGVPYLVVGDYFYVYYNEFVSNAPYQRESVARAKIVDVLAASQTCSQSPYTNCPQVSWIKFNGSWGLESGLTGTGSQLISSPDPVNFPFADPDLHTDAVYSSVLKQYLLLVAFGNGYGTYNPNAGLWLYSSPDGVTWNKFVMIDNTINKMFAYPTIMNLSSSSTDDVREVGSTFYIFYPRTDPTNYWVNDMYRKKITLVPNLVPTVYSPLLLN